MFVILFMLSFSIMHDSIIAFMENNESPTTQSQVVKSHSTQSDANIVDIHEIHSMFHFVGLMMQTVNTMMPDYKKEEFFQNLLQYTTLHKDTSFKPPIA